MDAAPKPPGLPEIRDEAAETPMWVPLLGLALLALIGITAVIRAAIPDEEPPPPAAEPSADGAEGAAPGEAPAGEAVPPAPANAPAPAPNVPAEAPGHEGHGH